MAVTVWHLSILSIPSLGGPPEFRSSINKHLSQNWSIPGTVLDILETVKISTQVIILQDTIELEVSEAQQGLQPLPGKSGHISAGIHRGATEPDCGGLEAKADLLLPSHSTETTKALRGLGDPYNTNVPVDSARV